MTIHTRFDVGEKVYFPISENRWGWGKVFSIDLETADLLGQKVDITYYIENRYDSSGHYFCKNEEEMCASKDGVIGLLRMRIKEKMDEVKEQEKGRVVREIW